MTSDVELVPAEPAQPLRGPYEPGSGLVYSNGMQALVRVLFDQLQADRGHGLRTAAFISGYPGSPLGGLDRELQAHRDLTEEFGVRHVPGHNEELAATAVMGSQFTAAMTGAKYDGVLGVWYGKAPGLDRATDALRHAQFAGAAPNGGAVAFIGDDPAAQSSTLPSSSEQALRSLRMPVLSPGTMQEIHDLGRHAVALSRYSGLWTALRLESAVADGTGTLRVGPGRVEPVLPELHWRGAPFRPTVLTNLVAPHSVDREHELVTIRAEAAHRYVVANGLNEIAVSGPTDWIGIVADGRAYHETVAALARLGLSEADLSGLGVRLLHIRVPYPLDEELLRAFARDLTEIVVVEQSDAFLEPLLKEALYPLAHRPVLVGRHDEHGKPLFPPSGTLSADTIARRLAARLERRIPASRLRRPEPDRRALPLLPVQRTPYFCSGCPHNTSTQVPGDALVGHGIGCHSMASRLDEDRVGTFTGMTQMGGEGAQWIGMAPFVEADHLFQNIGDGTYFHSGQLAVQAAVAAGVHITYKLLYNSAVAMTGGQSTSMSNALPVMAVAESLLRQGVARVIVTTEDPARLGGRRRSGPIQVWHRDRILQAQEVLRATPGVTALIHDQECAAESRRKRKRSEANHPRTRILINERVCEGCGDCGAKSNCLSVEPVDTEFGRKTRIDQASCNTDYRCLDGDCPSFVKVVPARRKTRPAVAPEELAADAVPEPPSVPSLRDGQTFSVRMPGIGGTGVVTAAQILSRAAEAEGLRVAGVDQTGMSQKAGPVVSDVRMVRGRPAGDAASGQLSLYLVCDLLVGLKPENLARIAPEHTAVVASSSLVPTGAMVRDVHTGAPDVARLCADLTAQVDDPARVRLVDARDLSARWCGDTAMANVVLLGAAYQAGRLPLSAAAIESAIEAGGVAVRRNVQAFRWGRMAVHDPARCGVADQDRQPRPLPAALEARLAELNLPREPAALVRSRTDDLVQYQNAGYAGRYLATLSAVVHAERAVDADGSRLSEAVARYLHKLMAYKDEYEVARLLLADGDLRRKAAEVAGEGARIQWQLHPPLLRNHGLRHKISLGRWATPALRALRAARRVRGTPFDLFGRTEMRRLERALVAEYGRVVEALCGVLSAANLDRAVRVAELPDLVRGYEGVKMSNVEQYRERLRELADDLGLRL
ncbi:MAG TPA: indolepyruvate ferredoxin oxidoreductase family protein [Amycolatopsis sp.]|nr:indolepyruvate ferredoxin oxidoreductase family protein [Amycolatopsis sp.]